MATFNGLVTTETKSNRGATSDYGRGVDNQRAGGDPQNPPEQGQLIPQAGGHQDDAAKAGRPSQSAQAGFLGTRNDRGREGHDGGLRDASGTQAEWSRHRRQGRTEGSRGMLTSRETARENAKRRAKETRDTQYLWSYTDKDGEFGWCFDRIQPLGHDVYETIEPEGGSQ